MPNVKGSGRTPECHPERRHEARGLCTNCYRAWRRDNDPEYVERKRQRQQRWRAANAEKVDAYRATARLVKREHYYRRMYGITIADYDRMFAAQSGKCGICRRGVSDYTREHFDVDHCHETGDVRGLLCGMCNRLLGQVIKEDWFAKAVRYSGAALFISQIEW